MDQYPDEDEEFELLYQDELEMIDEFPSEEQIGKHSNNFTIDFYK